MDDIDIACIQEMHLNPPKSNKQLSLEPMNITLDKYIVVGDFNSRSPRWGYATMNARGEEVEDNKLTTLKNLLTHYARGCGSTTVNGGPSI
jgi:hypothetical protein